MTSKIEAGKILMAIYQSEFNVMTKSEILKEAVTIANSIFVNNEVEQYLYELKKRINPTSRAVLQYNKEFSTTLYLLLNYVPIEEIENMTIEEKLTWIYLFD